MTIFLKDYHILNQLKGKIIGFSGTGNYRLKFLRYHNLSANLTTLVTIKKYELKFL
jgi:hypothetical protein